MTDRFLRFTMNGMGSVDDYCLVSPYPSDWLKAVTYHYGLEWTVWGVKLAGWRSQRQRNNSSAQKMEV
jgi:hypothetical protein